MTDKEILVERVAMAIEGPFLPHGYELKPHLLRAAARAAIASMPHSEQVEALEWYAEQVWGCRKIGSAGDPFRHALDRDGGERARKALTRNVSDKENSDG